MPESLGRSTDREVWGWGDGHFELSDAERALIADTVRRLAP
jgi:hypothetical protein